METQLNDTEVRVLGVLIEKEMTTPLSYPLTLNSVTTACNQKSNRYPVVDYVDTTVMKAIDSLRDKHLASTVFPGSSRTAKYKHDFAYQFGLNGKLQALLGVLMLRGPQTAGELRTRTERMVSFESLPAVIENLEELITREEGALVTLLPPGPGQKERRYAHLLAGEPTLPTLASGYPQESAAASIAPSITEERIAALEASVTQLREELAALRQELG
jgi:uncharacterized protein YceH (UPF0502 family)